MSGINIFKTDRVHTGGSLGGRIHSMDPHEQWALDEIKRRRAAKEAARAAELAAKS